MTEFSPREEINSWLEEIGQTSTDWVGATEISNFESSGWASTEGVAGYLHETIPPTHLEGCSQIQYESNPSELYPNARGTFDSQSREINVWTPSEQLQGMEDTVEPLTHQVGYNAYENIKTYRADIAEQWSELHKRSSTQYTQDGSGFISERSRTDECEDFAETYTTYLHDPEKLKFSSPEKYEFMKQEVWSGREYPQPTLSNVTYSRVSKGITFGGPASILANAVEKVPPTLNKVIETLSENPGMRQAMENVFRNVRLTPGEVQKILENPKTAETLKTILKQISS